MLRYAIVWWSVYGQRKENKGLLTRLYNYYRPAPIDIEQGIPGTR